MSDGAVVALERPATLKIGRQELRTRETRELLMRAAQTIFVRDGYEGADLKEIAELAGRTKGAIYGHFKSKEEIFLALIVDHRQVYRDGLRQSWSSDMKKNIELMRQFVMNRADDKDWALLQLEFKLFMLRHPESKERYKNLEWSSNLSREAEYAKIIGAAGDRKGSISRALAFHSVFPMLSALLLESEFDPHLMTKRSIRKVIAKVFDCLTA
ncbi:TetR/AcrR family transcriptional regulator [Acidipila sp. EB88]|uniref:TetR/AcrR family transcriptional regulator n=1 Tax=Acidipila sp. EB88 TaxID=2305226 RepID=UPI000F5DAA18|nr:TetR/AcrR family transcriptional regulator [Acidipila sp. EB88]RRA49612.1 TetR/AcrR family transcriptional regulator [Acidipila sp. EB88]